MPTFIPVGEWLPDLPPFMNPGALTATNVIPAASSYLPFPQFITATTALTSRCQGAVIAIDQNGVNYNYVGNASALYALNNTSWSNVTRTVGGAYGVPSDEFWEFAQWGETVIATNITDDPQQISLGAANFAALGGAPPRARHISVVGDFVVLGNIATLPQRVQWCAINNAASWTADAATLADFQDLPGDGGPVQKVVGGAEYGLIFQERAIFRMTFVGSPLIFQFDKVHDRIGCYCTQGVTSYQNLVFFISEDGFYAFDGSSVKPIGANKVDKTFFDDLDVSFKHRISVALDPVNKIVAWAYPSKTGNVDGNPSRILLFNWSLGRWSRVEDVNLELLHRFIGTGYTLDGLDSISTDLDALAFSLDSSVWTGGELTFGAFDGGHSLGGFDGTPMAARVDTAETQLFPNFRAMVSELWPVVHGNSISATIAPITRNVFTESASVGTAAAPNATGFASIRSSARYHRFRISTDQGTVFDSIQGVMVDAVREGVR